MIRRQFCVWCVIAGLAGVVGVFPSPATAQQSKAPARAKVRPSGAQPGTQRQGGSSGRANVRTQPRAKRPAANLVQQHLPKELEDLLVLWEQESSKIQKLRGAVYRYHYDSVFGVEKRAAGEFWYATPDMGRIDFGPVKLPEPAINPNKLQANGKPFAVQTEGRQRWICDGKTIYIIDDDKKIADIVKIPAHQQGKNIVNGPLPFLFGLKAEQAKKRYDLRLGSMHWPQGVRRLKGGAMQKVHAQFHIVARPKYEVDAAEWSRAEVILDATKFVPTAIRLIHPHNNSETVYKFPLAKIQVNGIWITNPFNDRPPSDYTTGQATRATVNETPVKKPQ